MDLAMSDTPDLPSPSIKPEVSSPAPEPAAPEEGASKVAGKDSGCNGLSPIKTQCS